MAGDPLQQLEREPARAYARLLTFANMGPGRSLKKAAAVAGCSESTLRAHAKDWQWAERIAGFDRQHLSTLNTLATEESTADHLAALARFRDQQMHQSEQLAEAAGALLAAALRTLESLTKQNLAVTRRDPGLLALTLQHVVAQGESIADFRAELSPSDRTWLAATLTAGAMGRA